MRKNANIPLTTIFENSAKIKRESAKNSDFIAFMDAHVAPKARFSVPSATQGQRVYCVNGGTGIAELVENGEVIAVSGRFVRSDEWKPSPWTDCERSAFNAHCRAESARAYKQERAAVNAYRQREALARQFTGK